MRTKTYTVVVSTSGETRASIQWPEDRPPPTKDQLMAIVMGYDKHNPVGKVLQENHKYRHEHVKLDED